MPRIALCTLMCFTACSLAYTDHRAQESATSGSSGGTSAGAGWRPVGANQGFSPGTSHLTVAVSGAVEAGDLTVIGCDCRSPMLTLPPCLGTAWSAGPDGSQFEELSLATATGHCDAPQITADCPGADHLQCEAAIYQGGTAPDAGSLSALVTSSSGVASDTATCGPVPVVPGSLVFAYVLAQGNSISDAGGITVHDPVVGGNVWGDAFPTDAGSFSASVVLDGPQNWECATLSVSP